MKKPLYGLKQAPKAWYDHLTSYLLDHGFKRGQVNRTLFVKQDEKSLLVAVRNRAPGPFCRMLGQTHVNGWSRVIASQNGS